MIAMATVIKFSSNSTVKNCKSHLDAITQADFLIF